jgi:hypothetical protein
MTNGGNAPSMIVSASAASNVRSFKESIAASPICERHLTRKRPEGEAVRLPLYFTQY